MLINPFIPLKDANTIIIAGNADSEIMDNLKRLKVNLIRTIECLEVDKSIRYHPDIVMHPINHSTLVIAPNVFDYYKEILSNTRLKLIRGERELQAKYPDDIAYNVGRIGDIAIHNLEHTDEVLKYYLKKEGIECVNVKQGYSKCSMTLVDDQSIITADKGIYEILVNRGYSALLIKPGYIDLEYQNYGFLGGATGSFSKKVMFLSGNIDKHPDKKEILHFIQNKNIKINFLSKKNIMDLGTIFSLNCY